MKFSVFLMGTMDGSYYNIVDQVCGAELLGFECAWLAERHFANADLLFPSPLVMAAYLAARTERIRLGLAACVLPLHHPLRVAEDVATLDILSNGRLNLGLSRGSMDEAPHRAFAVTREEARSRFDEAFEVLRLALAGRPFSFKGQYYDLDRIVPGPCPVQRPHPPFYLVANHPLSLDAAATMGLSVFVNGAMRLGALQQSIARYRERSRSAGFDPSAADIPVNRFIFVGESNEHARRTMRGPFLQFLEQRAPDLRGYLSSKFGDRALEYDFLASEIAIFGDANYCISRLRELHDTAGMQHVLCTFNFPTLEQRVCVESMVRFGVEVMPRMQQAPPSSIVRTMRRYDSVSEFEDEMVMSVR